LLTLPYIFSYIQAIDLLTDYIEPDLCLSKDGVFVAMHDLLLDDTTDVANFPEFADRRTTKIVEGSAMTGFFVDDFSYAELQMLHLKQRLAGRSTLFDGLFSIPSFSEIMYVYKKA
jgi:glycerophosphoryl diester phosphodiesterase